ncbi:radical SAM family heme chaperone HemW [Zunongwangia profunda]|uniref:Heme chaperone HemW n=2 Tax=Zunongwangia profunda TaxID=398743 RepID=D5BB59_ZUNPS|nr:radical SAM family heme chaperone HemW [Zunongwangia profunda]ADF54599.1 oxygen-independent coproporphyrinogen III oxidase [Zunongwangia profunda SM-A87]HCV80691.1 coproporphyrinogen III oxidase family protein [Zunongwangia profunda]|tara:strand:+ start:2136 stop:3263 length:1128 start_codon:yes stop_codon:yes gene_type:complete
MSGIYIHIPFCKQACHYCDFHFSTSLKKKSELVSALQNELVLRKNELPNEPIKTIYFGGGTPSLLNLEELTAIFKTIYTEFTIAENPEITLEANPDDLSEEKINELANSKINRLSIGVQSFFEEDLKLMNRAHNAEEALNSIKLARSKFDNISVDLIYGIPGMSNERWQKNIQILLDLDIPHISSYSLTVEPNTALQKFIEKGKIKPVDDAAAAQHFETLRTVLKNAGFEHYEFSNYGKPGYFSQNNTAYWLGKPYLGIGPSAHSYDGNSRKWNIANNTLYIKAIERSELPLEVEELSITDRYNEYIMTRLRTYFGVDLVEVESKFGKEYLEYLKEQSVVLFEKEFLRIENNVMHITEKGTFLSDGIAADLFYID